MSRATQRRPSGTLAIFLFGTIAQLLLAAVAAERCASFSFCAHSSQHTSTVLPPILTLTGFASSLQSQAAQVFSAMTLFSNSPSGARSVSHAGRESRYQNL